ncbi:MAG: hypothetical protein WCL14_03210 [Bacteroidota bacterium]
MTAEIYTENEKNLLALTTFFIEYFDDIPAYNEDDKKAKEEQLKYYKQIEKDIIHFANRRYEEIEATYDVEGKNWDTYHDVECTKCKFFTSLKPTGEEKARNGFTYFIFECPKCETKFNEFMPNTDLEKLNYSKYVHDYFLAKGKDGKINHVRLGISRDKVNGCLELHLKLKATIDEFDKSKAKEKIQHQGFADMVANEILGLTNLKQQILSGGNINGTAGDIVN